ncbi:unnamed protein product [Enterobius vermicularis]|uniref:Uncharacterized protein n=1 Tax=Enterobius vermicularis TaxID=51028 RepID=A0A0N4VRU6_ENTVE|nr:unnamed protein product [Enterobius vermicularis]
MMMVMVGEKHFGNNNAFWKRSVCKSHSAVVQFPKSFVYMRCHSVRQSWASKLGPSPIMAFVPDDDDDDDDVAVVDDDGDDDGDGGDADDCDGRWFYVSCNSSIGLVRQKNLRLVLVLVLVFILV